MNKNSPKTEQNHVKYHVFSHWILRWMSFLMIPLTFLYNEYIDQPNGVGTTKDINSDRN